MNFSPDENFSNAATRSQNLLKLLAVIGHMWRGFVGIPLAFFGFFDLLFRLGDDPTLQFHMYILRRLRYVIVLVQNVQKEVKKGGRI